MQALDERGRSVCLSNLSCKRRETLMTSNPYNLRIIIPSHLREFNQIKYTYRYRACDIKGKELEITAKYNLTMIYKRL